MLERRAAEQASSGAKTPQTQQRSWKLTAVQLLDAFKEMLKTDELNFNFDYCNLLRSCSDLMKKVLAQFGAASSHDTLAAYRFVNVVLWEAAATEKQTAIAPILEETMLHQSASLLHDHINAAGSAELDSARPRCSGNTKFPSDMDEGEPDLRLLLEVTLRAPDLPEAQVLSNLLIHAIPNAPDMRALRGYRPFLGLDPQLFDEFGCALREEQGIDFHMDPSTNIMSLYHPNAKDMREIHAFLDELWGVQEREGDNRAIFIPRDEVDDPRMSKRLRLGRKLCNALSSL